MSDFLRSGMEWLAGQLESNCSDNVTYTQGSVSVSVPATYGKKLLQLGAKYDSRLVYSDGDFLINAATIKAAFAAKGATFTSPNRGDLIAATFPDGTTQNHEVSGPPGEPHFQLDPQHLRYRVHTKKVT